MNGQMTRLMNKRNLSTAFILVAAKSKPSHRLKRIYDRREVIDYLAGTGKYADRPRYPLGSLLVVESKSKGGSEILKWLRGWPARRGLSIVVLNGSEAIPLKPEPRKLPFCSADHQRLIESLSVNRS